MRVVSYNLWDGGINEIGGDRQERILSILEAAKPDLLALLEARGFDREEFDTLKDWGHRLGMDGTLARAATGFHIALLARPPLKILQSESHMPGSFHNTCLSARVESPLGAIRVLAVHLNPFDPGFRLTEARHLAREAYPDAPVLLMGDFNAFSARDAIDESVTRLSPRFLARHIAALEPSVDGKASFDTRAIGILEWAGFIDVFRQVRPGEPGWTLPTRIGRPRESAHMRLDYIFATGPLADRAKECDVLRTPASDLASDHYPLIADFE